MDCQTGPAGAGWSGPNVCVQEWYLTDCSLIDLHCFQNTHTCCSKCSLQHHIWIITPVKIVPNKSTFISVMFVKNYNDQLFQEITEPTPCVNYGCNLCLLCSLNGVCGQIDVFPLMRYSRDGLMTWEHWHTGGIVCQILWFFSRSGPYICIFQICTTSLDAVTPTNSAGL